MSDEPRIVLYTADGTPLVRPVGFRVDGRSGGLDGSIAELPISGKAYSRLDSVAVRTTADLIRMTERELLAIPYLGKKTLAEIKAALAGLGLSLGLRDLVDVLDGLATTGPPCGVDAA